MASLFATVPLLCILSDLKSIAWILPGPAPRSPTVRSSVHGCCSSPQRITEGLL